MLTFDDFIIETWNKSVSDVKGPGKGRVLGHITDVETHTKAMQYHSTKYNDLKSGEGKNGHAKHVQGAALEYHTKMYRAHKDAVKNLSDTPHE
jgi:hypothetical protein